MLKRIFWNNQAIKIYFKNMCLWHMEHFKNATSALSNHSNAAVRHSLIVFRLHLPKLFKDISPFTQFEH